MAQYEVKRTIPKEVLILYFKYQYFKYKIITTINFNLSNTIEFIKYKINKEKVTSIPLNSLNYNKYNSIAELVQIVRKEYNIAYLNLLRLLSIIGISSVKDIKQLRKEYRYNLLLYLYICELQFYTIPSQSQYRI